MIIKVNQNSVFVFDLDDTLYCEIDFLKSAYRSIAQRIAPEQDLELYEEMMKIYNGGENTFKYVIEKYPEKKYTLDILIEYYRNHNPQISLKDGVMDLLKRVRALGGKIGILTNGRGITQRNKINSLGISELIDEILISEEFGNSKPDEMVYRHFQNKFSGGEFYYFGDNPKIDFIAPKKLKWFCVGVRDAANVHKFNFSDFSPEYLPHLFIKKFSEIEIV